MIVPKKSRTLFEYEVDHIDISFPRCKLQQHEGAFQIIVFQKGTGCWSQKQIDERKGKMGNR